jgi:hypothetical protein
MEEEKKSFSLVSAENVVRIERLKIQVDELIRLGLVNPDQTSNATREPANQKSNTDYLK